MDSVIEESFCVQNETILDDEAPDSPCEGSPMSPASTLPPASTSVRSPTPCSSESSICSRPAAKKKKISFDQYLTNTAEDLRKLVHINEKRNEILEKAINETEKLMKQKNDLLKEKNELLKKLIEK